MATSSTKAEFIKDVNGGKAAKHIRVSLTTLGLYLSEPTPLYVENKATIMMANTNKQTPQARNIYIQWFAIQEWVERKQIHLFHTPGTVNPAEAFTKALG